MHQSQPSTPTINTAIENLDNPTHSIFLIGEVGANLKTKTNSTLQLLQKHLDQADENSTVLFLGNNVGRQGMPSKEDEKSRAKAEMKLDAQMAVLENFKGQPIFISGNKDWKRYGVKGLLRQEKYIETALNKTIEDEDKWNNYFLPNRGCPGPEVVEINEKLVVIVIDSHWWLLDWDENPNVNSDCEVKSRAAFGVVLAATIKDHKNKNIVFATHHSFESTGPHGGKFSLKNHLFPFTTASDKAYVPLPGVGSLFLLLRQAGIFKQDLSNSNYRDFRKAILTPAEAKGEYIFVSGHDNSLQYLQDGKQHFVVSGAGSKSTPTAKSKQSIFSYGHVGFSKMNFYEDGSAWVEFWIPTENDLEGKMVFRYKMKGALPEISTEPMEANFPEYDSGKDSILALPTTNSLPRLSNFSKKMLGERRRALYLEKYNFPVLDLSTFQGGLKIIKKGGGKQTNSLRLEDSEGKQFVMRSLTKDLTRGVPHPFNQLPMVNFLFNENYMGSHPFAPLTLGTLANAANVYHTNPNIYYIPKQPALGDYNEDFGGEIYLVEERPHQNWATTEVFGEVDNFTSTSKLLLKRQGNTKHVVDQHWVVRSRLFDMLIGDFDRHGDQWRWSVKRTDDGKKIYRPIPRDRDQAFSHFDGKILKILSPFHSLVRQLATFDESVGDPKFNYYNGRHFDHHFMNEMTLEDWRKEARYIQEHVTDEVIDNAMQFFPKKAYDLSGEEIARILKYRRDNLVKIAEDFYRELAKISILLGSNKKELFEINRKNDKETEVKMYDTNKKGERQELLFHRIYKTYETNELYIYGLEDNDIFRITGEVNKGIKIHLIGGLGKDTFIDKSKVKGLTKKNIIYDNKKKNHLELSRESKKRTSKVYENNSYEYLGNHFDGNSIAPTILLGATSSNGIIVGFGVNYKVYKFNKSPLAQEHRLLLKYAFATQGFEFTYDGINYEAINHLDIVGSLKIKGDKYSYNFFGMGNESDPAQDGVDFYRVFQGLLHLDLGIQRRFASDIGSFSIRPMIERTDPTVDVDKFVNQENNGLAAENYETRWFAGTKASLNFSNVNRDLAPKNGFKFKNNFRWQTNLTASKREFSTYHSEFILYKSFGVKKNVVFATRFGGNTIRGNYDFFYAPTIGEDNNVRGFYGQRFRGQSNAFHLNDLRLYLGSVKNSFLPFSWGLTGSFDYGRVFEPGEESDLWHSSAGGAIWIAPLNMVMLSVSYNKAIKEDGARVRVFLGHAF